MITRYTALALAVLALSACATTAPERAANLQRSIEEDATTALNRAQVVQPVRGPVVQDVPYVDVRPVPKRDTLPLIFQREVTFNEPIGVPFQVLAQRIQAQTGVSVTYQAELLETSEAAGAAPGQNSQSLEALLSALPPVGETASISMPMASGISVSYSGPLKGLFDTVAADTGAYWRYEPNMNRVNFYRFETETFRIEAVVGSGSSTASIGGGSSGEGLSSGQASSDHSTSGSVWADVEAGVAKLLSPEGVYITSTSLGTLLVRDRPDRMDIVREFVREQNAALSTQVTFEVNVYRVLVRDEDAKGLNWNGVFQRLIASSPYQINFLTNNTANQEGLAQGIISVKPEANGQPQRWGGSAVLLQALSSLGNTSVVTSVTAVTVNNTATPVRVTRKRSYVAEISQAIAGQGGTSVATGAQINQEELETGLVMYLLPHVQSDGKRVLVKATASLTSLERFDTFTTDEQTVQQPQVASREFSQTAWLNSGETLVLSGFEQAEGASDRSSPFDWRIWPVSGTRTSRHEREIVVLTITPNVMSANSRI
jgi:type IVB pilus formation R64 PilN family outer membrane protein